MGKFAIVLILSSAFLGSQVANATLPTGMFQGASILGNSIPATCTVTIAVSGDTADISSCAFSLIKGAAFHMISRDSAVTFHNVKLNTWDGSSYGYLVAERHGTSLAFNATLPSPYPSYPRFSKGQVHQFESPL